MMTERKRLIRDLEEQRREINEKLRELRREETIDKMHAIYRIKGFVMAEPGQEISSFIDGLRAVALREAKLISGQFNGVQLTADPGANRDTMYDAYQKALSRFPCLA